MVRPMLVGGGMRIRTYEVVRGFAVLAITGMLLEIGCGTDTSRSKMTFAPRRPFTGTIFISVTENTGTREVQQLYRVMLDQGIAGPSSEQVQQIPFVEKGNSGAIGSCSSSPDVISPDGKYIAKCTGASPFESRRGNPDRLIVFERSTGKVIIREPFWDQESIKGLLWSPDSQNVAVLTCTEHSGIGPGDLLSHLFGHPVPYSTYTVDISRVVGPTAVIGTGPHAVIGGDGQTIRGFAVSVRYGFVTFLRWDL